MDKALLKALERQREITEAARNEDRDLTAEERREFNSLQIIIDLLNDESKSPGRPNKQPEDENSPKSETGESEKKDNPEKEDDQEGSGEKTHTKKKRAMGAASDTQDIVEIYNMCRHFNIDASDFILRGLTPQQAANEIIATQMKNNPPISTGIRVTNDENDKISRAMIDGIILRSGGRIENPSEGANNYRAMSLRDVAIECMERQNGSTNYRHMDTERFLSTVTRDFYNPESAFPAILDEVIKKSYVEGMNKAKVTFDKWVRFGSLPNFKKTTNHEYIMSLGGELERVPENGELKAYKPTDVVMPERQLETYGRQFTMSRKAFIDDDIGMITTMPRRYAELSLNTQNKAVYDILLENKKIFDGKTLFSEGRKNTLKTGTGVTLSAIQKMIYMIGIQKDAAGNQLALTPDLFIVPFGMGVEVNKILNSPTINTTDNTQAANPYYNGNFTVVEDVFLNGFIEDGEPMPWFMGVKGEIMQIDYLNGNRQATIRRSERPGTLGFVWDVFFDFGVSMLHPEAICRNPGIVLNLGE